MLLGTARAELPLGRPGLPEVRTRVPIAEGLTHLDIQRGFPSSQPDTGPWAVHVLELDLSVVEARSALSNGVVKDKQALTAMAADALAGVNGGYFVELAEQGIPGDPAGLSVVDGELVSEAEPGRAALLLWPGRARVARVETRLEVDGCPIDGVNRGPGQARNRAHHDRVTRTRDELILYTGRFGAAAPEGGRTLPDGSVLAAWEGKVAWLREHDGPWRLTLEVLAEGEPVHPVSAINGGPLLLPELAGEQYYAASFVNGRHPRTMAGITRDGRLLLVVVDGRQPAWSQGVTLPEGAALLRSLGALSAVNLDGGGSASMVVGGKLVSRPSEPEGRALGDAILVRPRAPRGGAQSRPPGP